MLARARAGCVITVRTCRQWVGVRGTFGLQVTKESDWVNVTLPSFAAAIAASFGAADVAVGACLGRGSIHRDIAPRQCSGVEVEAEEVRADFAAVVLNEMIVAFEREFEQLSVPEQVSASESVKQARWGRAFVAFLDELYATNSMLGLWSRC
jgi:hypothetical protein